MKPTEERIATWLHSRSGAATLALYAFCAAYIAWGVGACLPVSPYARGLGLPSANLWLDPAASLTHWLAWALNFGVALLMVAVNSRYNLLRDITRLGAGLFLVMQVATPAMMGTVNTGSVMAATMLVAVLLLYRVYNRPRRTRPVFLVFFLLAAGALTEYAYIAYIPVFYMGCAQMRAFTLRTFVASLLALVTPVWLAWSFGLVDFRTVRVDFTPITALMTDPQAFHLYFTVIATATIGLVVCVFNLVKVFSYNSRSRSYNGFVALLLLCTILFMGLDYSNAPFYLTLLNVTVAWQCVQYFIINFKRRDAYILILSLLAFYLALYIWRLALA